MIQRQLGHRKIQTNMGDSSQKPDPWSSLHISGWACERVSSLQDGYLCAIIERGLVTPISWSCELYFLSLMEPAVRKDSFLKNIVVRGTKLLSYGLGGTHPGKGTLS